MQIISTNLKVSHVWRQQWQLHCGFGFFSYAEDINELIGTTRVRSNKIWNGNYSFTRGDRIWLRRRLLHCPINAISKLKCFTLWSKIKQTNRNQCWWFGKNPLTSLRLLCVCNDKIIIIVHRHRSRSLRVHSNPESFVCRTNRTYVLVAFYWMEVKEVG